MKTENIFNSIREQLGAEKCRSAWSRGVNAYALELVDTLEDAVNYCGDVLPAPGAEVKNLMLNGASNWNDYSWGGSSLIYDCDIAERLCTPSELKKTKGGERRPNCREEWLDIQARALYQAANRVARFYRAAYNG